MIKNQISSSVGIRDPVGNIWTKNTNLFFQVNMNLHTLTLIIYSNGRDNFAVRGKHLCRSTAVYQ